MELTTRDRTELKSYFVKNAIPTESNFADFIDAVLNQKDDGIVKPPGNPLSIEASGDDASQKKAINFYQSFADDKPSWVINLNPRSDPIKPVTAKAGFSISDSIGNSRLFIDRSTGNIGIGTINPEEALEINGRVKSNTLTVGTWPPNSAYVFVGTNALDQKLPQNYALLQHAAGAGAGRTYLNSPVDIRFRIKNIEKMTLTSAGDLGIGTTAPTSKLEVNGFTKSLGVSVNSGQNTGVGRGLWLWKPTDPNHVIYSASPTGKSPANGKPASGFFDAGHRLRLRTSRGQGFLFENSSEVALVDIDSDNGNLWNKGALYCGNSDLYFSQTNHNHTGIGNKLGYAAIENAKNFNTLMILGRAVTTNPLRRSVSIWDELTVHGPLIIKKSHTIKIGVPKAGVYGNDGIRGEPNLWLDARNKVIIKAGFQSRGMDIAERFKTLDTLVPGDVVVMDEKSKAAKLCELEGDNRVVGVVSGDPAFILGINEEHIPIALCGRVPCKVDANFAPIDIGDILTTSKTRGHAQKVIDGKNRSGAIIGKALESINSGKGEIMIMVFMQ